MEQVIKNLYRLLLVAVLLWTAFSYRGEQQAQADYMALQERCLAEYAALPAGAEPPDTWTRRCALEDDASEIKGALRALDRAQKPFLAASLACAALLLAMAGTYLVQRIRGRGAGQADTSSV